MSSRDKFSYDPDLRPADDSSVQTQTPGKSAHKYQKGPNLGAEYTQQDLEIMLNCNSEGTYRRGVDIKKNQSID